MARGLRVAVVVAVMLGVGASSALADPPTRAPVPSGPLEFPAGLVCPFPVLLDAVVNTQTGITFSDGRTLYVGAFRTSVTNLATGESLVVNNPGPVLVEQNRDGTWHVVGQGTTVFYFFPGDLGPGEPGALLYLRGRTDELISADFTRILSFSHVGTTENLCETLA